MGKSSINQFVEAAQVQLGPREREALWSRGVSDEQIDQFCIGYINTRLPDLDYSEDFLKWSLHGARLRDMFVLPLTNTLGHVKGFQFRHVLPEEKGYSFFSFSDDEPITFGLSQAIAHIWEKRSVWLVEGSFDMFPVQRVYPNVLPTLTNRLSVDFVRLLRRLVDVVWVVFDSDKEGREAAFRTKHACSQLFTVNIVTLPKLPSILSSKGFVKDPSELWEIWGDSKFAQYFRTMESPLG